MRNLLFFCLFIVFCFSCSVDDNQVANDYQLEILPIINANLPEQFFYGDVYEITYSYSRPTSCHIFNDTYYTINGDERTIAVINIVLDETISGDTCEGFIDEVVEKSFNFVVNKETGSYVFKFWQGENENGEDLYLIEEVPIVD